jgi:hypothetical protein
MVVSPAAIDETTPFESTDATAGWELVHRTRRFDCWGPAVTTAFSVNLCPGEMLSVAGSTVTPVTLFAGFGADAILSPQPTNPNPRARSVATRMGLIDRTPESPRANFDPRAGLCQLATRRDTSVSGKQDIVSLRDRVDRGQSCDVPISYL